MCAKRHPGAAARPGENASVVVVVMKVDPRTNLYLGIACLALALVLTLLGSPLDSVDGMCTYFCGAAGALNVAIWHVSRGTPPSL